MIIEVLWSAYAAMIGALILASFAPGLSRLMVVPFAFPVGLVVVTLTLGTVSLLSTRITGQAGLWSVALVFLALCLGLGMRRHSFRLGFLANFVPSLMPVAIGFVWAFAFDTSFVVGDTMIQAGIVQNISSAGWLGDAVKGNLASWSFLYLFSQLLVVSGDRIYFTSLAPTMVSAMFIGLALAWYRGLLRHSESPSSLSAMVLAISGSVLIALLFFLSCFYFVLITSFVTSNFCVAAYGSLFVVALFACKDGEISEKQSVIMLAACIVGVGLSRVEGMVYSSLFIVWLISSNVLEERNRIAYIMYCVVVSLCAVNIILFSFGETTVNAILQPTQFAAIIGVFLLWMPFTRFILRRLSPDFLALTVYALALLTVLAVVAALALSSELATSLGALVQNQFKERLWGPVPLLVLGLIPIVLFRSREQLVGSGIATIIILFDAILLLSLGRAPYYVDINDSGHRLLGSFGIPAVLIVLLGCLRLLRGGTEDALGPAAGNRKDGSGVPVIQK